jgi:hypothetical protein
MSSMLDYHTPHLSLPAQGHGEGGNQVYKVRKVRAALARGRNKSQERKQQDVVYAG